MADGMWWDEPWKPMGVMPDFSLVSSPFSLTHTVEPPPPYGMGPSKLLLLNTMFSREQAITRKVHGVEFE